MQGADPGPLVQNRNNRNTGTSKTAVNEDSNNREQNNGLHHWRVSGSGHVFVVHNGDTERGRVSNQHVDAERHTTTERTRSTRDTSGARVDSNEAGRHVQPTAALALENDNERRAQILPWPRRHWKVIASVLFLLVLSAAIVVPLVLKFGRGSHVESPCQCDSTVSCLCRGIVKVLTFQSHLWSPRRPREILLSPRASRVPRNYQQPHQQIRLPPHRQVEVTLHPNPHPHPPQSSDPSLQHGLDSRR